MKQQRLHELMNQHAIPVICMQNRVGGKWNLRATKLDGTSRHLAGWFDNLITDGGMNRLGLGAQLTFCRVGTSSTAPSFTDTALFAQVASTNTIQTGSTGTSPSSPYFGYLRRTFRFGIGAAAGNLTEIGVGWNSTGGTLFARALIKDEFGDPTTVTVLSDEVLDATYELRNYAPEADVTGVVVTIGGVEYTFKIRASLVTSATWWQPYDAAVQVLQPSGSNFGIQVYAGVIGVITSSPAGATGQPSSASNAAYTNDSHYRDITIGYDLNFGNTGSGIKSLGISTTLGTYQLEVAPNIPKDPTKIFSITYRLSWARH